MIWHTEDREQFALYSKNGECQLKIFKGTIQSTMIMCIPVTKFKTWKIMWKYEILGTKSCMTIYRKKKI